MYNPIMNRPLAVQLYSVRDLSAADFPGTMAQLAKIGYSAVELAGFGNLKTAQEVRKACVDAGLKICGTHASLDQLEKEFNRVVEEAILFDRCAVVCPFLSEDRRKDANGWRKTAELFNTIGAELGRHSLDFAYHNHSFEFQKFDGKAGLDILYESTDPAHVKAELDVYWVQHGGADPVAYLDKLATRTRLVHLKDMAGGAERRFAPVGSGILDFPAILAACEKYNVKSEIVEQDNCYETPPLEAMRISFENIRKM